MESCPPKSTLLFPAPSKQVAILSIVFEMEPLHRFVEFLVLTDLPGIAFLEVLLVEELVRVFVGHVGFDGVTNEDTEVLHAVTGGATLAVTTGPGALMTSLSVELYEGSVEMLCVGGSSASNSP